MIHLNQITTFQLRQLCPVEPPMRNEFLLFLLYHLGNPENNLQCGFLQDCLPGFDWISGILFWKVSKKVLSCTTWGLNSSKKNLVDLLSYPEFSSPGKFELSISSFLWVFQLRLGNSRIPGRKLDENWIKKTSYPRKMEKVVQLGITNRFNQIGKVKIWSFWTDWWDLQYFFNLKFLFSCGNPRCWG